MTHRIRPDGPNGVNRPFIPVPGDHPQDQMAQALDHIAVVLSSIDSHLAKLSSTATKLSSTATKQTPNSGHISDDK
jgi:hypothetical protein